MHYFLFFFLSKQAKHHKKKKKKLYYVVFKIDEYELGLWLVHSSHVLVMKEESAPVHYGFTCVPTISKLFDPYYGK